MHVHMSTPDCLSIALKEWHAVTMALASGRQCVLLRKGGIHETEGKFAVEHDRFVLFPTWLHQRVDWVKPHDRAGVTARETEPESIELSTWAQVTDVVRVGARRQIDAIDELHVWLAPLIDMRFDYKPHNPLYLLIVRAWRLPGVIRVENTPAYAGCKSWVPLNDAIDVTASVPAMDDATFAVTRERIMSAMH